MAAQPPIRSIKPIPPPAPPPLPEVRRLTMNYRDGTPQIVLLFAAASPEDRNLYGALAGPDRGYYGLWIQVTNTGTVPMRFDPTRFRIHYRGESTEGLTLLNPLFLQPCLLEPKTSTQGLIMYIAHPVAATAIRLGDGEIRYDDPAVESIEISR